MPEKESILSLRVRATNEASPAFEAASRALDSLKNAFTELNPIMGTFSRSMESISGASGSLSNTFGEDATSTRTLLDTMRSLNESMRSTTSDSRSLDESFNSIERAISSVTMAVNEQTRALGAFNTRSKEVRESQLGALIAVQQLGDAMEHTGQLGERLFGYAIEQGADFQQSMKNIQTVLSANITGNESWNDKMRDSAGLTQQLQDLALNLGSRGAQSANEVAAAMDTMLRAGVDGKTILQGAAEAAQNVAIVTGDKLDESANLVTEIYHQFRESFAQNGKSMQENMRQTGDVLTGTLLSARISSNDFINTLKYVGPVASELGSSFTDAATATALLAQYGIKGSQAGTSLKRALTNLLEPTKSGAEAMKELGLIQNGHNMLIDQSTGKMKNLTDIQEMLHKSLDGLTEAKKAQYIHDMFGQYALAGSLVLANENSQAYQTLKEKIEGVSAQNAAASMLDTFQGHMRQLSAAVSTTAKEFGLSFLPAINALLPIGNRMLEWLRELTPANKEFLMGLLAVGSAVAIAGGALATFAVTAKFAGDGFRAIKSLFMIEQEGKAAISIFRAMSLAIKEVGLAEAFMNAMSPLGWIVLLGTAVAGAAMIIMQHWGEIDAWVTQHFGVSIPQILNGFWQVTKQVFTQVWEVIKDVWSAISTATQEAWSYISPTIIGAVKKLQDYWNSVWPEIKEVFRSAFAWMEIILGPIIAAIYMEISGWLGFLIGIWSNSWGTIKATLKLIWDGIRDVLRIAFDLISGAIKVFLDILSGNWSQAGKDAITAWNKIGDDLLTFFVDLAKNAWNWGKNFVQMFISGIEGMISSVKNAALNVANAVKSFLGFHSPTEEGPAADSDQWAPNFVKMFASGLAAGAKDVSAAANTMISPLSDAMSSFAGIGDTNKLAMVKDIGQSIVDAKAGYDRAQQAGDQKAMDHFHQMADDYRAKLTQMGYDASVFGADKTIPEAMTNVQRITQMATESIRNKFNDMTTGITDSLKSVSDDTTTYNTDMYKSWTDSNTKITNSTVQMNTILKDTLTQLNTVVKELATSMENAMTIAFDSIVAHARQMSDEVIAAVNAARAALASMPGAGNVNVTSTPNQYQTPTSTQAVAFGLGSRGGDVHVHVGGINVNGAGKDGQQIGNDIAKSIRQQLSFAI